MENDRLSVVREVNLKYKGREESILIISTYPMCVYKKQACSLFGINPPIDFVSYTSLGNPSVLTKQRQLVRFLKQTLGAHELYVLTDDMPIIRASNEGLQKVAPGLPSGVFSYNERVPSFKTLSGLNDANDMPLNHPCSPVESDNTIKKGEKDDGSLILTKPMATPGGEIIYDGHDEIDLISTSELKVKFEKAISKLKPLYREFHGLTISPRDLVDLLVDQTLSGAKIDPELLRRGLIRYSIQHTEY